MSSFFVPFFNTSTDLDSLFPRETWGPIFGAPEAPIGGDGGGGGQAPPFSVGGGLPSPSFGPIAGPVDIPPLFGTIGGTMPGEFAPVSARDSLLGRLIGFGVQAARTFLPGQELPPLIPGTGIPDVTVIPPVGTPSPTGAITGVTRGHALTNRCLLKTSPKGRNTYGRTVVINGQVFCVPKPRRMSPCNPHAARRAVRRLSMVHSFMRSIEKSMNKACAGSGHSRRRKSTRPTAGCGSCGKVRCVC